MPRKKPTTPQTLTPRERLFIDGIVAGKSYTQAALDAGYSEETAGQIGSAKLKKIEISAAVNSRLEKIERTTDAEIEKGFVRLNKLVDACEEALLDPENPEKYTLDADASEIDVLYMDYSDPEKPKRCRETLSALLDKVSTLNGVQVIGAKSRAADARMLIVKAVESISKYIDQLGRRRGDWIAPETHPNDTARNLAAYRQQLLDKGFSPEDAALILQEAQARVSEYIH